MYKTINNNRIGTDNTPTSSADQPSALKHIILSVIPHRKHPTSADHTNVL